jgi:hypothetical protein
MMGLNDLNNASICIDGITFSASNVKITPSARYYAYSFGEWHEVSAKDYAVRLRLLDVLHGLGRVTEAKMAKVEH